MHGGPHPWPFRARSAARSISECIARDRGSADVLQSETTQAGGSSPCCARRARFSVEKASSSLVGAMASGEGLLQARRGTVWDAPMQLRYARMAAAGAPVAGAATA